MCCGQKRQARGSSANLPNPIALARAGVMGTVTGQAGINGVRVAAPAQALSTPVSLRYLRTSPIRVRGAGSGRSYEFSASRQTQPVDRRDLPGLLRTGFFRQA